MTNTEISTDVTLAIKEELAQIAGWAPDTTLQDIGNQLGSLYVTAEQAGDGGVMQIISDAWGQVQALAAQGAGLLDIAAATKAALQEAADQNDILVERVEEVESELNEAREELEDLQNDLLDPWEAKSALVAGVVEMVEQSAYEYASDSLSEDVMEDVERSSVYNLEMIGVSEDKAERFVDIVLQGFYLHRIPAEKKEELRAFIEQFVEGL